MAEPIAKLHGAPSVGIATCALYLASEAGSWVTGQTLTVAEGL